VSVVIESHELGKLFEGSLRLRLALETETDEAIRNSVHHRSILNSISDDKGVSFIVNIDVEPEIGREKEVVRALASQHARVSLDTSVDFPFYSLSA